MTSLCPFKSVWYWLKHPAYTPGAADPAVQTQTEAQDDPCLCVRGTDHPNAECRTHWNSAAQKSYPQYSVPELHMPVTCVT